MTTNPYVLAGRRLRALGYEPGPNCAGWWTQPDRLRLLASDLRRRAEWRAAYAVDLVAELSAIADAGKFAPTELRDRAVEALR